MLARGLCASRAQAQQLIAQGAVATRVGQGASKPVQKAAQTIEPHMEIFVHADAAPRFVSRGGTKLLAALQHIQKSVAGLRCADFGQSTGGFTDCLLQSGACSVVGVDVGQGQLHPDIRNNANVLAFEQINLKQVDAHSLLEKIAHEKKQFLPFDFAVADLSFISLGKVMHTFAGLLEPGSEGLFLVKPQFELGPHQIGKNGLVKNLAAHLDMLEQQIREACACNGFEWLAFFPCAITGGDGNQEFFVHTRRVHEQAPYSTPNRLEFHENQL